MAKAILGNIDIHYESIRVENPIQEDLYLIFLHEALGSIQQWKSFPRELCTKLNLNGIVYDRQGHGLSSPFLGERDSTYLHNYALKELPLFIDCILPPDSKVILVGHSDGGSISLLYSSYFQHRVHSIITMAAHVINEPETIAGIQPAIDAFESGKLNKLFDFHVDKTRELVYAWSKTWMSSNFINWNICHEISEIKSPLLSIQGENDQYGTRKQLELIEKNVRNDCTTVLLNNCGHHPHLEKPNETISIILSWISDFEI